MTNGIGVARKLFGQAAFKDMVGKEVFPGKDNTEVRFDDPSRADIISAASDTWIVRRVAAF